MPPETERVFVDVSYAEYYEITLEKPIAPVSKAVPGGEINSIGTYEGQEGLYENIEEYPEVLFEVEKMFWWQGYKLFTIRISPVKYFPKQNTLRIYRKVVFKVVCTLTHLTIKRHTSELTKKLIGSIAVNPEKAGEWIAPEPVPANRIPYVIITVDEFVDEFKPLADWRKKQGVNSTIVTLSWIQTHYLGDDDAEKVRNFIIYAYNNWNTEYVLLGGDYDKIPVRYCHAWVKNTDTGVYYWEDYVSEAYYAFLDGVWDPDGDQHYLESRDDDGDGYPEVDVEPIPDFEAEVYVGRLPAGSEGEVEVMVDKILTYEMNPPSGTWFKKALLFGAISNYENEDHKGWKKTDEGKLKNYIKDDFLDPRTYSVLRFYEGDGLDPSSYDHEYNLTDTNFITYFNQGASVVNMAAHGSYDAV